MDLFLFDSDSDVASDDEGVQDRRFLVETEEDRLTLWEEHQSRDRVAAAAEQPLPFKYDGYSQEARKYYGDAEGSLDDGAVNLVFNASDNLLVEKAVKEREQVLTNIAEELGIADTGGITAIECFAACMPPQLMKLFANWTGVKDVDDLVNYLKVETLIRFYTCSATALFRCAGYNTLGCAENRYFEVRKAMRAADKPMPARDVPPNSEPGAYNRAFSVPPEMTKLEHLCSKHWSSIFFIKRVTWGALDDDKIPNTSWLWEKYGIQRTPTKEKKLKPVVHLVASIATGLILAGELQKLKSSVASIIQHLILILFDAQYPEDVDKTDAEKLCLFIDRGYIRLARHMGGENDPLKSVFQVLLRLGVSLLGTCKKTKSFPFDASDGVNLLQLHVLQRFSGVSVGAHEYQRHFYLCTVHREAQACHSMSRLHVPAR